MTITTTNYGDSPVKETLYFAYDGSSHMTVTYNGDVFYYVTNLQGDVVAILDTNGSAVVTYTYDAWGNLLAIDGSMKDDLGAANPLTYRGYVYDTETSLYYLQSRYYNPYVGRFINADAFVSTGQGLLGNNMFAYCLNNPIRRIDSGGALTQELFDPDGDIVPDEDEFGGNGNNGGTPIYRYGYNSAEKLVPSQNDVDGNSGLSFSTRPRPGSAVTTIGDINSTGKLYAVQDSAYHVTVYPIGGTISQWRDAGANSIWTQALVSVVVKN